ncbi:DUF6714 family protein [Bordetella genomosp. 6]|uniref:DUF6714 family protein n=1 Tax=Bordetella genomosp. 6 TaxID=463024 RepID=UPI0012F7D589|nr:DUF6714 family protein [Bordetella genomosp. 6]
MKPHFRCCRYRKCRCIKRICWNDAQAWEISSAEWVAAGRQDAWRSWQDYSDDELIRCEAALAHLHPAGWVYYLLAFLLFALRHCGVLSSNPAWSLASSVVFIVTHRSAYSLSR